MSARPMTRRSPIARASPIRRGRSYTRTPGSRDTSRPGRGLIGRKKKPPRRELTAAEKRMNRKLARIRVHVEHVLSGVKRSRIVKDVLRNTKDGVSDSAMEAACGLHNLRAQNRKRPLRR